MQYWKKTSMDMQERAVDAKRGAYYAEEKERTLTFLRKYLEDRCKPTTMMDVCCGTGRVTADLAQLPYVINVFAIDINAQSLDCLSERLSDRRIAQRVQVLQADVMRSENPLPDADIAVMLESLIHLPDIDRVLHHVYERLSDHGLLVANIMPRERIWTWRKRIYGISAPVVHGVDLSAKWLARFSFLHPILDRMGLLRSQKYSKAAVQEKLTRAGFKILTDADTDVSYWFVAQKQ